MLSKPWKRAAVIVRIFLLLSFLGFAVYACFLILFPSQSFEYFFLTPSALKNTIIDPRIGNEPISKGKLGDSKILTFNTNTVGNFSHATIEFELAKKSAAVSQADIQVRKSFRAFFYPQGNDAAFPDGTLLFSDGKYYIVSLGKLRTFANIQMMQQMGFSKQMFWPVDQSELSSTPQGEDIKDNNYPQGAYFFIDDEYYQLTEEGLAKFVSENAFRSHADVKQAVAQTSDIFANLSLSEKVLGFRDGSLVSSADSVFILSDGKRFPIDNTLTFTAMGYSWDDVVPVTAQELSLYEKQKLFTQNSPHPDGTVFTDRDSGKSYLIKDGQKLLLSGSKMEQSYLRGNSTVLADLKSLDTIGKCDVEKKFNLFKKKYVCVIPIDSLHDLAGNDYQFSLKTSGQIDLDHASVTLHKVIGKDNLNSSLVEIKGRIRNTYYGPVQ